MAEHRVGLVWKLESSVFAYETYNRAHRLVFKNGATVLTASAAPAYRGDGDRPDPEDMFVAALSSCHMLSFLAICAKKRVGVESYEDDAVGFLENDGGKLWMTRVILRPKVVFSPQSAPDIAEIHHLAHEVCFIASSVRTEVSVEPR